MVKNAFIAITGRPNVGKSSLTNLLVGEKISIVSEKPQTTRNRINGVLTRGEVQFVFIDTPGLLKPRTKLGEFMARSVKNSVDGVDCAVLMADATKKISPAERELCASFAAHKTPTVLLLNKIDLLPSKADVLPIIEEYSKLGEFREIIPISVKTRENTEKILPILENFAADSETGEHFFPDDIATDRTERFLCGEIIREKLLWTMLDEIPHGTAVDIESFSSRLTSKGEEIIDLGAVIICEKTSHKGMIIGKNGSKLKKIGTLARADIEDLLGCKVNMTMFVKVKENWRENERFILEYNIADDIK